MDLKTFVSDSLVGIVEGVQSARERTAPTGLVSIAPAFVDSGFAKKVPAKAKIVSLTLPFQLLTRSTSKGKLGLLLWD